MERLACVNVPALPLQMVLQDHRDWRPYPVAVVAEDRPQSPILWVNGRARKSGVAPGLSYASALSLLPDLRAAPLVPTHVARTVEALAARLRTFSPEVETSSYEPGVFWANVSGLDRLYASLEGWAAAVRAELAGMGFTAIVVVGFTRFGTSAAVRVARTVRVFADSSEEREAAGRVPLVRLAEIPPETLTALHQLGVRSVSALLDLPAAGLLERFGPELHRLHRMAAGDLWTPLQPQVPSDPIRRSVLLDDPESDSSGLLFLIKRLLHPMLAALASRGEALAALDVRLRPDRQPWHAERIRPAAPTLDGVQILDLVGLRLESATPEQIHLFTEHQQRDLEAGNRALARLRAELGDDAVVRAVFVETRRGELLWVYYDRRRRGWFQPGGWSE